jgi:hypothetical protein
MAPEQSVGRFVNKSIKNETLRKVAVWSRLDVRGQLDRAYYN